MSNIIDKIQLSGVTYDIGGQGGSGVSVVEVSQAEYDALPSSAKTDTSKMYVITDAQAGDLTNYYTKTETNTLLGGKADTATTYTKTEVDNAITAATATKQDTLVSSENIKTINNESLLGSGNIDVQGGGGGKAIEAGRGISITTGETADTVSFNLPISAGTGQNSIIIGDGRNISSGKVSVAEGFQTSAMTSYAHSEGSRTLASGSYSSHAEGSQTSATSEASHSEGYQTTASGQYSHSEGSGTLASGVYSHSECYQTTASGQYSHSEGSGTTASGEGSHSEGGRTTASGNYSHSEGENVNATNQFEHSQGRYNVSNKANTTFGDSGNTLFSVGNGTADEARHNAFEIRQNGDIYLTSGGTDIKLQDHLGGGGGGGVNVVQTTGTSTADVMSQDAVTTQLNGKADKATAARGITYGSKKTHSVINLTNQTGQEISGYYYTLSLSKINGKDIVTQGDVNPNTFSLVETSAITTSISSSSTDAQVPSAKAVYDQLGGLKLVKLSQSAYDALSPNYDSNTLYVIVN